MTDLQNWTNAYYASQQQQVHQNVPGFLATITSPEEYNFILNSFGTPTSAFLGATDSAVEGKPSFSSDYQTEKKRYSFSLLYK